MNIDVPAGWVSPRLGVDVCTSQACSEEPVALARLTAAGDRLESVARSELVVVAQQSRGHPLHGLGAVLQRRVAMGEDRLTRADQEGALAQGKSPSQAGLA